MRYISAYRIFRKSLLNAETVDFGSNANLDCILSWSTSRFSAIESRHHARAEGKSGYTLQ